MTAESCQVSCRLIGTGDSLLLQMVFCPPADWPEVVHTVGEGVPEQREQKWQDLSVKSSRRAKLDQGMGKEAAPVNGRSCKVLWAFNKRAHVGNVALLFVPISCKNNRLFWDLQFPVTW